MLDFSQKRETTFDLIAEGTYEVICSKCVQETNNFDEPIISLQWKIREDVEQGFKGRVLFDDIRQDKDKSTATETVYNDTKIYNIVFGGQDQSDPKSVFKFADYDELCLHLNGICMRIDIQQYTIKSGVNAGKKINTVKIGGYHPSQAKPKTLGSAPAPQKSSDGIEVTDDDLPF